MCKTIHENYNEEHSPKIVKIEKAIDYGKNSIE